MTDKAETTDSTGPEMVTPNRVDMNEMKNGGYTVYAFFDHAPVFARAIEDRTEATEVAKGLFGRTFVKPDVYDEPF